MNKIKVIISENSGFCYGVKRAIELTSSASGKGTKVHTLGPIIHNPQVIEKLKLDGVFPVNDADDVQDGILILRTHGVAPNIAEKATSRGLQVIDSTCPFVKKAQQITLDLLEEGYFVVIVGERDHPEVQSLLAYASDKAVVLQDRSEAQDFKKKKKVGVVVQTTQSNTNLSEIIAEILPKVQELKIFNTICNATSRMQTEAAELAEEADVMFVVGGRNSANTSRLADICREITTTYHVETEEEVLPGMLEGDISMVGIVGGASTPKDFLENVQNRICQITNDLATSDRSGDNN